MPEKTSASDAGLEGDQDLKFRKMADSFIDVANRHCENSPPAMISSSFLFGASRFCAFVVAGKTGSRERYLAEQESALDYYAEEFRTMLKQNLEDYGRVFDEEGQDPASEKSP